MTVNVRYFAAAAEAAAREEELLSMPAGTTLGGLKRHLVEQYGEQMRRVVESGSFLIDGVVRKDDAFLIGEGVDVLPPFAGG